jgi:intein-encoded DNA endonuclease-like protein
MGRKKLDENDYKKIIELKQNGYSNADLANMFEVTSSRIGQILRGSGISSVNERYLQFSDEECEEIVSLYRQGVSAVKIGKIFGCSKSPITRVLNNNGIQLNNVLRKIPESEYQNVVNFYNDGYTQEEVAKIYGCAKHVVSAIMKKVGAVVRPNGTTKETAEEMYKLYIGGKRMPEIAKIYNMNPHTIGRVFQRNGLSADRKTYHCDEHYFDVINNQDKAYILGLLWSDGCNQLGRGKITIQLQERDQHILEEIKEVSKNERPLHKTPLNDKNPNWQNSMTLTWQSRHVSQTLNDYGMVPRKSLVLKFPDWLSVDLYPHFLRGYIDGDGSIYYSEDRNVFRVSMVGTKMFLNVVQTICANIGIKTSMSHKKEHSDVTYTLSATSNTGTLQLLNWIYKDANLKIERKYQKYKQGFLRYNINNSLAS